ncbi:hypothetical protein SBOR_0116 [Sclerotinia borealis F-4128]|uniref:Uncharacterized protein n=1 Tax=Sclerotinia borealis (strain F-4128) TaxID=1432307 RepID=W9CUH0_SCLBF|nr:hypothetical protein SBOR_0116 [Sclerotinia borealis F-4128]
MGKLVGLISSGIGLAMEAKTSYSSSNKTYSKDADRGSDTNLSQVSRRTPSKAYQSSNDDQAYRDLQVYADYQNTLSDRISDDMQRDEHYREYLAASPRTQSTRSTHERDVSFYAHELPSQRNQPARGLSCPVILPQRRPEAQSRGIIRAYSLELADCGIDEDTFLDFIDDFNEAHKASPYLDAVNVAAQGVGFAPGITPMVVSMVVPIAVRAAKGYQTQRQSTSFLDRANAELFIPHGLFAMVLTFKPSQTQDPHGAPGEVQLPLSAPLIYPEDDRRAQQTGFKKMGHFIADYGDRRAQARYAYSNPDSTLASPLPKFESRWGDPNHAANSGGLKSLLTGVPNDKSARKQERQDRKQDKKGRRRRRSSSSGSARRGGLISSALGAVGDASGRKSNPGGGRPTLIGAARGMVNGPGKQDQSIIKGIRGIGMQTDILYLMITNNSEDRSSIPSTRSQTPSTSTYTSPPFPPFPPAQTQPTKSEVDNWSKSQARDQQLIYPISYPDRTLVYPAQQQQKQQNNNPYTGMGMGMAMGRQDQVASPSSSRMGYVDHHDAPPPAYREAMPTRYYDRMRQHDEEFYVPTL